jgi:pimeloyl-ACP methyl ester carboxylesterase
MASLTLAPRLVALAAVVLALPARAQERSVADLRRSGETVVWAFEQGGERIGHCASRYAGEVDLAGLRAHRFEEQVQVTARLPGGTLEQRYRCELWTDENARPLRFVLEAAVADTYSSVDAVLTGEQPEAVILQGGKERTVPLEVPEDAYLLANNFVSHIELLLAFETPEPGEEREVQLFSANVLRSLDYRLEHAGELDLSDGGPGVVVSDSLGEVLRVDAQGRLLACEIPAQGLVLRRVEEAVEPLVLERPAPPDRPDLDREEVRIDDGEVSLAGTLTRPKGAEGPLPGVFFVSGSGGQDRDGLAGGIDVGTHEILDRLTLEGFSVLRVDDRGVGESTGPTEGMTFDDLVEDARRCVRYLRGRTDVVDPGRIVLIGHSEGGMTVPILAAEDPAPAAVVLLAAPARPLAELTIEQYVAGQRLEGLAGEQLVAYEARVRAFFEALARGEALDTDELPPELAMLLPARAWLESHARVDPLANLARVRCPVLVLQGERDVQVSAERDARALEAALDDAGNPDHELVVFPTLDHLFKATVGETSSGLDYLKARPVSGQMLDVLAAWLTERVR